MKGVSIMHAIPRTITLTLLLLATTIWGAAPAQAAKKTRSTTSDSTTTDSATTEVVSVNTVDLVVQAKKGYANSVKERILAVGGALKKDLPVINGAAYRVPADRVEEITNDAGVAFVSIDSKIRGTIFNATQAVGAYIAEQYGYTGKGIGVAVIDSGIDRHPDIRFKIGTDTDIIGSGTADDQYGHGTHVAGIIAGEYSGQDRHLLDSNVRYRGIAPGAKILSYKVLNAEGWGHESDVIDAIDQAIRMKDIYNIRVMNLSLGRPFYESYQVDPLCRAAQKAWDAGIVVVVAAGNLGRENSAGNEGYGTITAPANTPSVISVGAMKTMDTPSPADDEIASYSSKGPTLIDHVVKPDLVAPGNRMVSLQAPDTALDQQYPQNVVELLARGDQYFKLSGTSMAAPMVSGAVALLLEKEPNLTPHQVKARLMKTASKNFPTISTVADPVTGEQFVSQYDIFTVGAGYLDVAAMLMSSDTPTSGTAESPTVTYDEATGEVFLVSGDTAIWGRDELFGETAIWGRALIEGTTAIWGRNVVWGDTAIWGRNGVDGSTAIWGRSDLEGSTAIWGRLLKTLVAGE